MTTQDCIYQKATWLGKKSRVIKQIIFSIFSYLTTAFHTHDDQMIETFFRRQYYEKPDELIFDGTNDNYLSILTPVLAADVFSDRSIVDIGCGCGSFYLWLARHGYSYQHYSGIDRAFKAVELDRKSVIRTGDIVGILDMIESNSIAVLINTLCYLSPDKVEQVLSCPSFSSFVIVDPIPGFFWDAHFSGIKPFYRGVDYVKQIMESHGYKCTKLAMDFGFKFIGFYFWPLLYAMCFSRS